MDGAAKHEFALYTPSLSSYVSEHTPLPSVVHLHDEQIVHRILHILRLGPGERVILFDEKHHLTFEFTQATNKKILTGRIVEYASNVPLQPRLTVLLPLLKKDDLETALYSLVEVGVSDICLVNTAKVHKRTITEKDMQRYYAVMYAAAEQAKYFALPALHAPRSLEAVLAEYQGVGTHRIVFEVDGAPALHALGDLSHQQPEHIIMMIGPEGGLTSAELQLLEQARFQKLMLTPTVLRACQAVMLGAGMIRACMQ